jgi:psp operon transcriptional activator
MNPPLSSNPSTTPGSKVVNVEALGQSEAFLAFTDQLSQVAPVNRPVLLIGERGTGKELAASRLHYLSPRWQRPLVTLNCAALVPTLIEAELFGYEKGAFTGAEQQRAGRFETADGGTLFLDEIGNLPLEVQAKLLRVVEYGIFERVGGTRPIEVDARIIGATNADLAVMAQDGRFKPDLLDRLAFEVLVVPPLRQRIGDIELLADYFAAKMALELNRSSSPVFSPHIRRQLLNYNWPGNIRELKNVVERAVYRNPRGPIEQIDFHPLAFFETQAPRVPDKPLSQTQPHGPGTVNLDEAVNAIEIRLVQQALSRTRYNQRKAARLLGLSYDRLRGLLRKHAGKLEGEPSE